MSSKTIPPHTTNASSPVHMVNWLSLVRQGHEKSNLSKRERWVLCEPPSSPLPLLASHACHPLALRIWRLRAVELESVPIKTLLAEVWLVCGAIESTMVW
jgi:hypothetical protein